MPRFDQDLIKNDSNAARKKYSLTTSYRSVINTKEKSSEISPSLWRIDLTIYLF
jgi:hypothetical protein